MPLPLPRFTARRIALIATIVSAVTLTVIWFTPSLFVPAALRLSYLANGVRTGETVVEGHAWPYLEAGNRKSPPMIMLHGFGTGRDAMMSIMPWIDGNFRCIAPDLPGFGLHPFHSGKTHDVAFYAAELLRFADSLGIGRFDLMGTSMGGGIAAYLAARYPERVRTLILLSPAGLEPDQRNYFMRDVERGNKPLVVRNEADFDRVVDLAFDRNPLVPWQFRKQLTAQSVRNAKDLDAIVTAMQGFLLNGLNGELSQIKAPTLVIWGDRDLVTDPSMLGKFVKGIPNAKGILINDGGHVVTDDSPEQSRRAITEFLGSQGGLPAGR